MNNSKFVQLVQWAKIKDAKVYTDENMKESIEWAHKKINKQPKPFDYFYYIIIIFIVIIMIIIMVLFFYGGKKETKELDDMRSDKNNLDNIEIVESDVEYDEYGNEIIYTDE